MSAVADDQAVTDEDAGRFVRECSRLAARINDLDPSAPIDGDSVAGWSDEERASVVGLLDNPPETISDVPEGLPEWIDAEAFARLAFAALRRKLDTAMKRDDRVRKAERRLSDEKAALADIDCQIEDLKKERKGAEAKVEAAVFALQRAVTDQGSGQIPLFEESDDEPAAVDPAKAAPITELGLSASLTEKLVEAEINRVGDLIDRINADDQWHRKIKGVGEKRIDDITDALNRWRTENPAPEVG